MEYNNQNLKLAEAVYMCDGIKVQQLFNSIIKPNIDVMFRPKGGTFGMTPLQFIILTYKIEEKNKDP